MSYFMHLPPPTPSQVALLSCKYLIFCPPPLLIHPHLTPPPSLLISLQHDLAPWLGHDSVLTPILHLYCFVTPSSSLLQYAHYHNAALHVDGLMCQVEAIASLCVRVSSSSFKGDSSEPGASGGGGLPRRTPIPRRHLQEACLEAADGWRPQHQRFIRCSPNLSALEENIAYVYMSAHTHAFIYQLSIFVYMYTALKSSTAINDEFNQKFL